MRVLKLAVLVYLSLTTASVANAQSITGFQPFGTFSNPGPETIDLGDLNVHWSFPLISKSGRIPLSIALDYDSSVYTIVNNGFRFTPGFKDITHQVFGYIPYTDVARECTDRQGNLYDWD